MRFAVLTIELVKFIVKAKIVKFAKNILPCDGIVQSLAQSKIGGCIWGDYLGSPKTVDNSFICASVIPSGSKPMLRAEI